MTDVQANQLLDKLLSKLHINLPRRNQQFILRLAAFLPQHNPWIGTATELLYQMEVTDVPANSVMKILRTYALLLHEKYGIWFLQRRTGAQRTICIYQDGDG